MNTQPNPSPSSSPLVPQGSLLDQKNKGRARVKIAVFFVLAIHGIGLMALLMQGCQKEKEPALSADQMTNAPAPPAFEPTNAPVAGTNELAPGPAPIPTNTGLTPAAPSALTTAPALAAGNTEYTIAKGDSFYTIAKKFHVTTAALVAANPTVEATKLQIGQKIQVPPSNAVPAVPAAAETATTAAAEAGGAQVYTVKSGDSLSRIATHFGVSVKAIRTANSLKTDSIKVGQKLKIPAKAAAPGPATTESTSAPVAVPGQ